MFRIVPTGPEVYFSEQYDTNISTGGLAFDEQIDIFYRQYILPLLFGSNNEKINAILRQYDKLGKLIGRPGYPDLGLPANPITNSEYDTYPDFFFYNLSDSYIMSQDEQWKRYLDNAKEWMAEANRNLKTQIFKSENNEWGLTSASFFFSDLGSTHPKANPISWDGMQIDKPHPPYVAPVDKEGNPWSIDVIDYDKTAEKGMQGDGGKAGLVRNKPPRFTNAEPDDVKDRNDRFKEFSNKYFKFGGQNASILFDLNGKALGLPKNDTELIHEFSPQHYAELLNTTFRKEFYYNQYSMRRAFPTFKIYLIDENLPNSQVGTMFTDDFYSVDSIQSITVVRHRDLPADLAVVEIINTDGRFTHKMFEHGFAQRADRDIIPQMNQSGGEATAEDFKNLAIKDGTKVQIRLGFANDPNELETVFNGQIVSLEGSQVVTMTCQSYGTELVQNPMPPGRRSWWWNADTDEILSDFICSPECKHFGRFEVFPPVTFSYGKIRPDGKIDRIWQLTRKTQDDNIFTQPIEKYWNVRWSLFKEAATSWYTWLGVALMTTGILLPVGAALVYKGASSGFLDWQPQLNQTIWDVFKEMELRHPGWIAMPVPYQDRMTMFFGVPTHEYFYRDSNTAKEMSFEAMVSSWRRISEKFSGTKDVLNRFGVITPDVKISNGKLSIGINSVSSGDQAKFDQIQNTIDKMTLDASKTNVTAALLAHRIKPFRQYHLLTSENDIIANNIRADHKGVSNAIRVMYNPGRANDARDGRGGLDLAKTGGKSLVIRLDDDIEPEFIQEKIVVEPNASGDDLAQRYAIGHLLRECRRYYRGELVILGNPKIKPTDVCFCVDSYSDIVGPIEVERVTHIFRPETGFITEIVPNMCCTTNEDATLTLLDGGLRVMGQLFRDTSSSLKATAGIGGAVVGTAALSTPAALGAGAAATSISTSLLGIGAAGIAGGAVTYVGPVVALGVIGLSVLGVAAGGLQLLRMMMGRNPIILYPLLRQGKPYASGLQGYEIDGLITHLDAKWTKWFKDVDQTRRFYQRGVNAAFQAYDRAGFGGITGV